jgi:hypothetical protein
MSEKQLVSLTALVESRFLGFSYDTTTYVTKLLFEAGKIEAYIIKVDPKDFQSSARRMIK